MTIKGERSQCCRAVTISHCMEERESDGKVLGCGYGTRGVHTTYKDADIRKLACTMRETSTR